MSDPKEPAFPRSYTADGHNGITMRDWFAGQFMAGASSYTSQAYDADFALLAKKAFKAADAMLKEREA